jgi:CubicO group peptidase (beta-lactamase class C family)
MTGRAVTIGPDLFGEASMRSLLVVALLATVGPVTIPDTPAGRTFSAWLTAFNAADRARLEAVFKQFLEPRSVEEELDFRQRTGGLDLKKVVESTPTRITAWLQDREAERIGEARMELEAQAPYRVQRFDVRQISTPPELAPPRLPMGEALRAIRARIDQLAAEARFSGSVLIVRQGKVLLKEVRGLQDREKKVPNRLDTKFNLGSMNKMFTAVATLQLVQQGKLKLDDPVGKYLPDYPNADVAKKVTVHHLLSHTGGMGDIFGPERDANLEKLKQPRDYVALYGKRPPEFEPGSRWAYSNYGMVVAGAIVEKVSGMGYYDYVRKNIYERAGMTDSDSYWKTAATANLAKGYTKSLGRPMEENYAWLAPRGEPAGGGYSTVEDLVRFATALTGHRLLDEKHTALLTTPKPGVVDQGYGYGFQLSREGSMRSFGHHGGGPGINSDLKIIPDAGYVIAVMGNLDPPAAFRVANFAAARLPLK